MSTGLGDFVLQHDLDRVESVGRYLSSDEAVPVPQIPDWEWKRRARNLARAVEVCSLFPAMAQDAYRQVFQFFFATPGEDVFPAEVVETSRQLLHRLFYEMVDVAQRTLRRAEEWQAARGEGLVGVKELGEALGRLRRLESDVFRHWPSFTVDSAEDAGATGEALGLADAFAEIAGVDRETWLRKVEEYKRRRPLSS